MLRALKCHQYIIDELTEVGCTYDARTPELSEKIATLISTYEVLQGYLQSLVEEQESL